MGPAPSALVLVRSIDDAHEPEGQKVSGEVRWSQGEALWGPGSPGAGVKGR